MNLEVMYFGKLRQLAGGITKEVVDTSDSLKLADLLVQLGERFGDDFRTSLREIRDLRILVNGREYQLLGGMTTVLKEKDTVVLLPPVFGG